MLPGYLLVAESSLECMKKSRPYYRSVGTSCACLVLFLRHIVKVHENLDSLLAFHVFDSFSFKF